MKTPSIAPLALAAAGAAFAGADGPVTPAEVAAQSKNPRTAPLLLDVRSAAEFAGGHVPGAVNIPVGQIEARAGEIPRDRPVVVYCEVGGRSRLAATQLRNRGYANVREMTGSLSAWRAAGLPVEK